MRPGRVFRLYSHDLFLSLPEHNTAEVLRMPLENTILKLRAMMETSAGFQGRKGGGSVMMSVVV